MLMHLPKSEGFLEQIMSYIKFPFDKATIKKELEAHLLDKIDSYMENGYDKESAEQQAIFDMGDAKEIGVALNKQHNPIIGWLWKVTNVLVILLVIWNLYFVGSQILITLFSNNPVNDIPKTNIVYNLAINKSVQIDDVIIKFTNVIYEKNGDMNIIYKHYDKNLFRSGWGLGNIGSISDNLGNTYFDGSGSSGGIFITTGIRTLRNFSSSANTLIISYDNFNRKYKVEIPLKEVE